jgi:hypothetical protein
LRFHSSNKIATCGCWKISEGEQHLIGRFDLAAGGLVDAVAIKRICLATQPSISEATPSA